MLQKSDVIKCIEQDLLFDGVRWTKNDVDFFAFRRETRKTCEQIMALMKALDESQREWNTKYEDIHDKFTCDDVPNELLENVNEDYPLAIEWLMDTARQCMRIGQYVDARVTI